MFEIIVSIVTLTLMEIVLGIDNVIFISLALQGLDKKTRKTMRMIGMAGAFLARVILLSSINHLSHLNQHILFTIFNFEITWHNIVMLFGGGFLIYKSLTELHEKYQSLELVDKPKKEIKKGMIYIILQIIMIDIVFSFDSILTAIGLADQVYIMIAAVVLSMTIMLFFSEFVSNMIEKYPTIKNLALCFLILVGFVLFLEGMHFEVPKGCIYAAIGFGLSVEIFNITLKDKNKNENQIKTYHDFDKFITDYDFLNDDEKLKIRKEILTWVISENNKELAELNEQKQTIIHQKSETNKVTNTIS